MIGSAMVTMATELFCLNKSLENLRYFHVVFLSVDLRVIAINIPSDVMTIITTADVGLKSELVERGF
jgi:hypothetical protein